MKKLEQRFSVSFHYDVFFTRGLFHPGQRMLAEVVAGRSEHLPARVFFVIDEGVARCHPHLTEAIVDYCAAYPGQLSLCGRPATVPGGEAAKNDPGLVEQLLEAVHTHGIDRHAYLIAIGGGALLDLAGLAAAIAHRGIRHIRIPTTVLSQNDSGIGVKNGINFFGKKNFLGTFAPPVAVINDFDFLRTLDQRDWRAGIAEAVKVSLIKDASFFTFLEKHASSLNRREEPPMEHLIEECARLHLEHIAGGDPFEMGSSRPLDFGHWAAHKLEQLTDYALRHGEAVAIGIALDSTYSYLSGLLPETDWQRILYLLTELGFQLYDPALDRKQGDTRAVINGLEEFREHLGGQLTIMLLEGIGRGREVHHLDTGLLNEAIDRLRQPIPHYQPQS